MVVTKAVRQYLTGDTDNMSEKDIRWAKIWLYTHRPMPIKICGTVVGVIHGLDIKVSENEDG